jgi:hypothetical protein
VIVVLIVVLLTTQKKIGSEIGPQCTDSGQRQHGIEYTHYNEKNRGNTSKQTRESGREILKTDTKRRVVERNTVFVPSNTPP